MPGLSTDIVIHCLPIKEYCRPVQQKLRRMRADIVLKIKEEVKKQFDVGFLQEVKYSEWVANIVPVPKKDGKVRMCVDYRNLNKASPKENFHLPHIDTLVDNTTGYSLFFFMDGFSGYNQIKMHPEDMEKTTFITFERKIEIDSDKVWAIQELPPPHSQKEIRGFLRRLNYISRFVSQLAEKCDPIFRLLKKRNSGVWDDKCQKVFYKVKQYLPSPPVLSPLCPDSPLILYLIVFNNSMGCVLGQHDDLRRREKAIYYLSKKFIECEMRYSPIEILCCALIWTTRRLRKYMLYHTTWLISKLDPLKYMMKSTALNGRMVRWQILLSEFDIVYVSQKAMKGSAVANFLARRALEEYEPLNFDFPNEELMYVAATEEDATKDHLEIKLRRNIKCCRLRAAIKCKIKALEVYGDSALVIYQLKGEWETRDPKFINYRRIVLGLIEEFDDITFNYLPRDENQMTDALATLASMIKVSKQEDVKPIQMSIYEAPDGEVLYKRRKDHVLLRCVDAVKAKKILEEVYEGVCETHANGFTMARQIIGFGYYWPTMEGD
ncbi:reverse transcriptase [Gossypium australe]|uniref:Reverse transcriptase n=1 Tax=Gossypium australe TaxID=47621 RepID=A0A5B6V863_9ROSI|nr:reverse transcriptase [Gossypium australe]